jgi:hypothetical protein
MRMRNMSLLLVLALVTAAALGTAVAYAQNGADDPAGHVSGGHGADDMTPTVSTPPPAAPAGQINGGHGADDPIPHVSGGHGADDPVPHVSSGRRADDRRCSARARRAHRSLCNHRASHRHGADDPPGHR